MKETKAITVELSANDVQVLQCWANEWATNDMGLFGGLSYKCAHDLCDKLGLETPLELSEMMDGTFEKRMDDILAKKIAEKNLEGVF